MNLAVLQRLTKELRAEIEDNITDQTIAFQVLTIDGVPAFVAAHCPDGVHIYARKGSEWEAFLQYEFRLGRP